MVTRFIQKLYVILPAWLFPWSSLYDVIMLLSRRQPIAALIKVLRTDIYALSNEQINTE